MPDNVLMVFTTFPDVAVARHIGTELVARQYAACVNLLPAAESIYRWDGEVRREVEVVAILKTTRARLPELVAAIKEWHPYRCPEVVAVAASGGLPAYLEWVAGEVGEG